MKKTVLSRDDSTVLFFSIFKLIVWPMTRNFIMLTATVKKTGS